MLLIKHVVLMIIMSFLCSVVSMYLLNGICRVHQIKIELKMMKTLQLLNSIQSILLWAHIFIIHKVLILKFRDHWVYFVLCFYGYMHIQLSYRNNRNNKQLTNCYKKQKLYFASLYKTNTKFAHLLKSHSDLVEEMR